jgi:hypothetical protein
MDLDLVAQLRASAKKCKRVVEIPRDQVSTIVADIATNYVADSSKILWWEALKRKPLIIGYEGVNGLSLLKALIGELSLVELIVTDEEIGEWIAFRGALEEILLIVSHQRYFEYMICDPEHTWLIFDTHHNEFVVVGSILERARNFARDAG